VFRFVPTLAAVSAFGFPLQVSKNVQHLPPAAFRNTEKCSEVFRFVPTLAAVSAFGFPLQVSKNVQSPPAGGFRKREKVFRSVPFCSDRFALGTWTSVLFNTVSYIKEPRAVRVW
jgi:hypothetical protein